MIDSDITLINMVWGGFVVCLVGVAICLLILIVRRRQQEVEEETEEEDQEKTYEISLENRQTDEYYVMDFQREIIIGRSPEFSRLILQNDRSVSKKHFKVSVDRGAFVIEDLNSSNHTWLNGRRVTGRVPIKTGDRVVAGYYSYLVKLKQVS